MMRRNRLTHPRSLLRSSFASIAIATLFAAACDGGDTTGRESSEVLGDAQSEIGGLVVQTPVTATRHHDFDTGLTTDVIAYQAVAGTPTPYVGADLAGTSFSFGDLEEVDDPGVYPARVNVALAGFWDGGPGTCSGTLIDSRHFLTAAHCLYREEIGGYANSIIVVAGDLSAGYAEAVSARVYTRFVDDDDWDYDIAVVEIDRPLGALVGWHGYAVDSCWELTHDDYTSYSFPGEPPYNGDMYFWDGSFDWCPLAHTVQTNTGDNDSGIPGMSGGGVVRSESDGFRVAAVWSRLYDLAPAGTRAVKLWNDAFGKFHSFVHGHRPDEADLIPVGLRFPDNMTPAVDATPSGVEITVHNYSDEAWSGPVNIDFYASTNSTISAGDTWLGSVTPDLDIPPMGAVTVDVPGNALHVPASLFPGAYDTFTFVGAILDVDDGNGSNNVTIRSDVGGVLLHHAESNLTISEIDAENGTYSSSDDLPVSFQIDNLGELASGGITGLFYLDAFQSVDADSILLGYGTAPPVAAGGSYATDVELDLHGVPSGNYFLHLVIQDDATGEVIRRFDATKIRVKHVFGDILGQPANLRVDYLGFNGTSFESNDDLAVAYSVTNTGAQNSGPWQAWIYASPTPGYSDDMVLLAAGSSAGLAGGAANAAVKNVSLSPLDAGDYHLVMIVAAGDESTTTDNTKASASSFEIEMGFTLQGGSVLGP